MSTVVTAGLILIVVLAVFLFSARRVLRLALKLAMVGALVLFLLAGAAIGWWRGWFNPSTLSEKPTQSNQRSNSNRRAPSR